MFGRSTKMQAATPASVKLRKGNQKTETKTPTETWDLDWLWDWDWESWHIKNGLDCPTSEPGYAWDACWLFSGVSPMFVCQFSISEMASVATKCPKSEKTQPGS